MRRGSGDRRKDGRQGSDRGGGRVGGGGGGRTVDQGQGLLVKTPHAGDMTVVIREDVIPGWRCGGKKKKLSDKK